MRDEFSKKREDSVIEQRLEQSEQRETMLGKEKIFDRAELYYTSDLAVQGISGEEAKKIVDALEELPEYQKYKSQRVKIDALEDIVEDFQAQIEARSEKNELAAQAIKMLKNVLQSLKLSLENYYQIIRRTQTLGNIHRFRMSPEQFTDLQENSEERRRRIHNSIINNLRFLTRFVQETAPDKFGVEISSDRVFAQSELEDRVAIGEWAYYTALGARLEKYREKLLGINNSSVGK